MPGMIKSHARRIAAIAVLVILYWFTKLPDITSQERAELAGRFHFVAHQLPQVAGAESRQVRPVHPSLQHISAWISAVGAAIALADLDGDALSNDICFVDTRTDQVVVTPVPGSGERFVPFFLDPGSSLFDRSTMAPMGCIPGDLNEDGQLDVLVYYWGRTPVAFLRRAISETAAGESHPLCASDYAIQEIVPGGERWCTNAATRCDVDGDGHVDLLIGNYFQDQSRILDAAASGSEQMQNSMSRAFNGGTNRLLLWTESTSGAQPAVECRDIPDVLNVDAEPVAKGWTLAIGAVDIDEDLLPEIYFANDFGPDRLLHNRSTPGRPQFALLTGMRGFTTPSSKVVGEDSFKGMGVDFGDVNADGELDIYVSNIADDFALEESHFLFTSTGQSEWIEHGIAPFVDSGESLGVSRSGWGWDSRLGDFDNDGMLEAVQATGFVKGTENRWPELHEIAMGNDELLSSPLSWHRFQPGDDLSGDNHNPFFVRASDGRFYDLAAQLGIDQAQITRGVATADVDADGDLDFAAGNQWESSRFYENQSPRAGEFLVLRLLLPLARQRFERAAIHSGPPRAELRGVPAIGATARVELPAGRTLVGQVDGGNGHSGVRSSELHFGLGDVPAEAALRVDVHWRGTDGRSQREVLELSPGWHTVVLAN